MNRYYVDMRYAEEVDDTQLSPTRYERIMVPADEVGAEIARLRDLLSRVTESAVFYGTEYGDPMEKSADIIAARTAFAETEEYI